MSLASPRPRATLAPTTKAHSVARLPVESDGRSRRSDEPDHPPLSTVTVIRSVGVCELLRCADGALCDQTSN
jgi:hypothetical protein